MWLNDQTRKVKCTMKRKLLTGWNFGRVIYVLAGGVIIVQSAIMHEWIGILIGGYFASMGLFALGCAAGNCFPANDYSRARAIDREIESVEFEEIK
jgi:hypothetical protein